MLLKCQRGAMDYLMKCGYPPESLAEKAIEEAPHIQKMRKLNNMNWQYFFYWFSMQFQKITSNPAPDFECI